jgi:hypothetical protein
MKLYIILIISFIVIRLTYNYWRKRKNENEQYAELLLVFKDNNIALPEIKLGSSYGWTTYVVTFANKSDYEYAEQNKLFELFDKKVESFHGSDFKADMAVYYKYPGKKITVGGLDLEV